MIDLATLEWTFSQVFDGPGVERETLLDARDLALIGPDRWPTARIETVPCLKVIELRFPLNEFYTAARRGDQPAIPAAAPSWLAITRATSSCADTKSRSRSSFCSRRLIDGQTIGRGHRAIAGGSPDADVEQLATQLAFVVPRLGRGRILQPHRRRLNRNENATKQFSSRRIVCHWQARSASVCHAAVQHWRRLRLPMAHGWTRGRCPHRLTARTTYLRISNKSLYSSVQRSDFGWCGGFSAYLLISATNGFVRLVRLAASIRPRRHLEFCCSVGESIRNRGEAEIIGQAADHRFEIQIAI